VFDFIVRIIFCQTIFKRIKIVNKTKRNFFTEEMWLKLRKTEKCLKIGLNTPLVPEFYVFLNLLLQFYLVS
jgi:hypothetical protein